MLGDERSGVESAMSGEYKDFEPEMARGTERAIETGGRQD